MESHCPSPWGAGGWFFLPGSSSERLSGLIEQQATEGGTLEYSMCGTHCTRYKKHSNRVAVEERERGGGVCRKWCADSGGGFYVF